MRRSSVTKYRSDRLSHIMSTETKKAKQRSNRTNVKSNQENISNYLLFYTFTLHEPAPPHCIAFCRRQISTVNYLFIRYLHLLSSIVFRYSISCHELIIKNIFHPTLLARAATVCVLNSPPKPGRGCEARRLASLATTCTRTYTTPHCCQPHTTSSPHRLHKYPVCPSPDGRIVANFRAGEGGEWAGEQPPRSAGYLCSKSGPDLPFVCSVLFRGREDGTENSLRVHFQLFCHCVLIGPLGQNTAHCAVIGCRGPGLCANYVTGHWSRDTDAAILDCIIPSVQTNRKSVVIIFEKHRANHHKLSQN